MSRLKRILPACLLVAIFSIPYLIRALSHWHAVPIPADTAFGPADPDPWVRLTLVRDWLSGGSWYDHGIHHSGAPDGGVSSPWTRPMDMLIAFFTLLQPDSVELSTRLMRAALLVPWVSLTLLLAGVMHAIRMICPLRTAQFMGLSLIVTMPAMWNYFGTANADHHSMLAALFAWVVACMLDPQRRRSYAYAGGILSGVMLWISPEALILIGMLYAWLGLRWLMQDRTALPFLAHWSMACALTSMVAIMLERPIDDWLMPVYDSLSIVYFFILMETALLIRLLTLAPASRLLGKSIVGAVAGGLLMGSIWFIYPLALHGPLATVDPYIFSHFLPTVVEAESILHHARFPALAMLLHPLLALGLSVLAWRRRTMLLRPETALPFAFMVLVLIALLCGQIRWFYYVYPVTAIALAPWLGALFSPESDYARGHWPASLIASLPPHRQGVRRLPIVMAVLFLPWTLLIVAPTKKDTFQERLEACEAMSIQLIQGGQLTQRLGQAPLTLLTHTNLGGHMLYFTPYHIVASNYHREGVGIRYVWEAYDITDAATLRNYLATRGVDALFICPQARNASLLMQWQQGEAPLPDWLTPVPYRIPPPAEESAAPPPHSQPLLVRVIR